MRTFLTVVLFLFSFSANAIEFRIIDSKVLALWSFVLGATSAPIGSATSIEFYKKSSAHNEKTDQLIDEAAKIIETDLSQGFDFKKSVPGRNEQGWDARKHFLLQASIAKSLADFKLHTSDALPYPKHKRLFEILVELLPVYEKVIWNPSLKELTKIKAELNADFKKLQKDQTLEKLKKFYNSGINSDAIFNVHLIPVPASRGGTHCTVVSNEVFAQVFAGKDRPEAEAGTLVHEVSHYLYETQPREFQEEHLAWFDLKNSNYGRFLYQSWDEILATVTGNGYGFEIVKGKVDENEWYQNHEFETISRGIYPKLKEYLKQDKKMDHSFVEHAVRIFKERLPNAERSFFRILKSFLVISDEEVPIKNIKNPLKRTFHYSSMENAKLGDVSEANASLKRGHPDLYPDDVYKAIVIVATYVAKSQNIQKLDIPAELKEKIKSIPSDQTGYFLYQGKNTLPIIVFQGKEESEFAAISRVLREKFAFEDHQVFRVVSEKP